MAPRKQPSERQRRLGVELRKLRTSAGISGDQAAALLDADRARISNIEAGRIDVTRNRLYMLLREYGCPPGALFDGLMAMAQESGKGWWDGFRDVVAPVASDLAELESRSTLVRMHEPLFVPGMLQTEGYARAVIAETESDPQRVERFVAFRVARQRVLTRDKPVAYRAVIHESALRAHIGGPGVMRKQLSRLIEAARLPNVTVQIFPYEAGAYSAYSRSFVILGGATPELDTVYLEHPHNSAFLRDGGHVDEYAKMFERLSQLALAPVDPDAAPESHEARDSLSVIQHALYTT
ncbi:helix-turn-helix domain-containing protein [Streptomyces triculaminicus]|uniref:helix-turn-helix domain-containing protein n=1 Tax=Streptomyces triculaminicus TaxID=2816232 RepID=UPI0037D384CF